MSKYAVLLDSSTDDVGPTANAFQYALDLEEAGHEVDVLIDGEVTQWPEMLTQHPDHPINDFFEEADDCGLIAGGYGFSADSLDVIWGSEAAGVEVPGSPEVHAPNASEMVAEDYELLTIG